MEFKVIRRGQYKTTNWSGGTTTELFIFPPGSEYKNRNFTWRLSSASVQTESSTFTSLPGISRIIMVLEGSLQLEHKNYHSAKLGPFDQDSFEGEWVTESYGKAIDFNLMMSKECRGNIEAFSIKGNEIIDLYENKRPSKEEYKNISEAIYCVSGQVEVLCDITEKIKALEGDLILITRDVDEIRCKMTLSSSEDVSAAKLIRSTIYY